MGLIQKKLDSFHITKSVIRLKTKTGKLDIPVLCKHHSPMVKDNGVDIKTEHHWLIVAILSIIEDMQVLCSGILLLMTLITSSAAKENIRLFLYSKIVKQNQIVMQQKLQLLNQLMPQLLLLLQNLITVVVINHGAIIINQANRVQVTLKILIIWTVGIFNTSRTRTITNINITLTERKMFVPRTVI